MKITISGWSIRDALAEREKAAKVAQEAERA
jgi:hypothetical protein